MLREDLRATIEACLDDVLVDITFADLPAPERGKVRDNYDLADGRRLIVATDRQSAFDQVLTAVPFKGQLLTATARFWFEATRDIMPNHVLAYPDPNILVARRLSMLPVEVVVRDYLSGATSTSIWPMYAAGLRRVYGIDLPDGLKKNGKLPRTILTPTTKGEGGEHDRPVNGDVLIASGRGSEPVWGVVVKTALALFARGRDVAAERGLILVDTKYEFGIDEAGRIVLADEIHTPDSSRYWLAESYPWHFAKGEDPEALDKDFLRRWIAGRCDPYRETIPPIPAATLVEFALRYIALYETVTGARFVPPPADLSVAARIHTALRAFFV